MGRAAHPDRGWGALSYAARVGSPKGRGLIRHGEGQSATETNSWTSVSPVQEFVAQVRALPHGPRIGASTQTIGDLDR